MDKIISKFTGIRLDKFYNSVSSENRQSFLQWFYHSFCLNFHLNILIIYISAVTIYPMIRCQHNSIYTNVFIDHYCLFNLTYVNVYQLSSSDRKTWFENDVYSNDIRQPYSHYGDYSVHFHDYYPHLIAIFAILVRNFFSNYWICFKW